MAENLLQYGFSREDGQAVGNVLTDVQNLINRQSNNFSEMKTFLQELVDIKKTVFENEKKFYAEFGATNYDTFVVNLNKIQNAYSALLANGRAIWAIRKEIDFANIEDAYSPEEVAEALQIALEDFLSEGGRQEELIAELANDSGQQSMQDVVLSFIQRNLRLGEASKNEKAKRFITSRSSAGEKTKVGLGKLVVGYDLETQKFLIETENISVSSAFKKKLQQFIGVFIQRNKKKIQAKSYKKGALRQKVNEIALSCISDTEAKDYIKQTMQNKSEFDLMPNLSSVIGYLGEIRAVAMLKHLMPNKMNIRGTGSLRSVQTGDEIPIDVVCESYGFQIKNYTLHKETVSFTNSALVPHILESRMRLSGSIYDILIALFGVYQYNQPLHAPFKDRKGNERPEPKNLPQYISMYNSIYGDSNSLFYQLKPLFDARVPQMLKMSETFSVKGDQNFMEESVYFNTFYWINSKLVPSSYILEQLINQLSKGTNGIINTVYSISQPDSSYTYQKQPQLAGNTSMFSAANKLRMSYEIDIDLSNIK